MSKRWLALALWVLASGCLAQSPTLDKIRKTGTITLGYVDGAGTPLKLPAQSQVTAGVGLLLHLDPRIVGIATNIATSPP